MQIVLIVIYCLSAAAILFALTFHDELLDERRRKEKLAKPWVTINTGKPGRRRA